LYADKVLDAVGGIGIEPDIGLAALCLRRSVIVIENAMETIWQCNVNKYPRVE